MPSAESTNELADISGDIPVSAELLIEIHGERFAYAGEAIGWNSRQELVRTSAPLALGSEVTIHLARMGRSIPGLIVSEARELLLRRLQGSHASILHKPFTKDQLASAVQKATVGPRFAEVNSHFGQIEAELPS